MSFWRNDLGVSGVRWLVTVLAGSLIVLHLLCPDLKIDAVTVGLLVVLVLPWTAPLVESIEVPGIGKIAMRAEAAARSIAANNPAPSPANENAAAAALPPPDDPQLALVALRIEIEKRVRKLAELLGRSDHQRRPLRFLLNELRDRSVLNAASSDGLTELVSAGNQAAHGGRIGPATAEWAQTFGPKILAILDDRIREMQGAEPPDDGAP